MPHRQAEQADQASRILREARLAKPLTQEELADILGKSQPTISSIEKGRPIVVEDARRWLEACGALDRWHELGRMGGQDSMEPPVSAETAAAS